MPYRIDPNTGQPVWDGTSIPQASRDSLAAQIRSLQDQIDNLSFIDLDDVPATYTGQSGKIISVKSTEDGLEFITNTGGGGVTDGDKGDITVAGSGATWTIDASAVTEAKIADGAVTANKIGTGAVGPTQLASTAVTAGSYTLANITVDADGRITAASNGSAGSGTVTSVSVATANGVSGSVANATTTPEITLTLGAITPSSVNGITLSGSATPTLAVTGTTTVSGTNTGDQNTFTTIAVSGQSNVVADSTSDTLTLVAGSGVTITTNATTDTITISATATGGGTNTILQFFPKDAEFPSTGFATIDTRNNHPCLDFADSGTETAFFTGFIPQGATFADSGTALTVVLESTATSATTGNIGWSVALERIVAGGIDIDADAFGTAQSANTAVSGTSGVVSEVSVTFTKAQLPTSLAAGDQIRVRVQRNTGVSGNHSGDAELLGLYANMTPATT